ncbi:hypothetical protein ACLB1R_16470 [Escherichia coli]
MALLVLGWLALARRFRWRLLYRWLRRRRIIAFLIYAPAWRNGG